MSIQQVTGSGTAAQAQAAPAPQTHREASTAAAAPAPAATPSPAQVQHAAEQIQRAVAGLAQDLQFSVDQGSGKTVIRVVDSSTNEVIRQIPTEEAMSLAEAIDRMRGLLLDGKA